jgi:UDP-glucuronate 4-epimerase
MIKIGITGCAGFIGFNLARDLVHSGQYDVVGFDNFNSYYDPQLKYDRAIRLMDICQINVDNVDLLDKEAVDEWLNAEQPDIVIHLAGYAGIRHSLNHPEIYVQNNIVGTNNLIEGCTTAGIDRVLYASTSSTMAGNPLPWNEDEKLGRQLNPYAYSKQCNEQQFMSSTIQSTIGMRFFTVYGPWGRPDMALFDFTKRILNGEPINVFNDGLMYRDFTYIDDIVNGIICLIDEIKVQSEIDDVYNIGRGKQVLLTDFIKEIEFQLGKEADCNYLDMHPADTKETWADTTKIQSIGYRPEVNIEEGVEMFIAWYKKYYGIS